MVKLRGSAVGGRLWRDTPPGPGYFLHTKKKSQVQKVPTYNINTMYERVEKKVGENDFMRQIFTIFRVKLLFLFKISGKTGQKGTILDKKSNF